MGVHDPVSWKGNIFPLEEKKQIVAACKYVDRVVDSCKEDTDAWDMWHYDKMFVGLEKKGVKIIYFPR